MQTRPSFIRAESRRVDRSINLIKVVRWSCREVAGNWRGLPFSAARCVPLEWVQASGAAARLLMAPATSAYSFKALSNRNCTHKQRTASYITSQSFPKQILCFFFLHFLCGTTLGLKLPTVRFCAKLCRSPLTTGFLALNTTNIYHIRITLGIKRVRQN